MPTEHHYALPAGSLLHSVYRIQEVLGAGAFGITYLAKHVNLDSKWVIKEYLPEFAIRQQGRVSPSSADRAETFNWGLSRFFNEAKLLHGLSHPNIVKVNDLFEENGTAYFVMPDMGKRTLLDWIAANPTPSLSDLTAIFVPLLEGLTYIHERGLLHRDIKPANILLTDHHEPVLIDFGSARFTMDNQPLTQLLTPNFAPIEQYGQKSDGYTAALDIYSLSACLYQAITGNLPEAAPDRIQRDTQIKLAQNAAYQQLYPAYWLAAIDKGLSVNAHERFQTASEMKQALLGNPSVPPKTTPVQPTTTIIPPKTKVVPPRTTPTPLPQKQKPVANIQNTPPKSSGSLKKIFMRLVGVCVLGGVVWGSFPWLKQNVLNQWLGNKAASDKPYRDTVQIQVGGKTATYTGWLKNGVAEDNTGTATLKFADGTQCTVGMSNNQRHGTGKCVYPKGSIYDGAWKNDAKHGYGKYTPPKASPIASYEGGFVNGKLSGKGVMTYKNGAVFAGEFAADDIKTNGKGAMTGMFGMSSRCEGTFTKNRATCQFKQGNSVIKFSGRHKNGLWSGAGEIIVLENGVETDRYSGIFRNGDFDDSINSRKKAPEPESPPETIEEVPTVNDNADKSTPAKPASGNFDHLF